MKTQFIYQGFTVEVTKQENAASATAFFRNGEPFTAAFVHLENVSIEEKIKAKIDRKIGITK